MGVPPLMFTPSFIGFPVHQYVSRISVCDMGNISLMLGIQGVVPICWGYLGASAHGVSMCLFFYILVAHCVSHFYYGYDYYSSSYGGVFWAVICFIIDHGSFPDGASCNIGSVWSGSTPPLMSRGSGGVIGPTLVPQQQPPCSMPPLGYGNYAMGSPQVGFFFRVEPPTILYIICWCPFWCLLSTFRCQVGCHIHL